MGVIEHAIQFIYEAACNKVFAKDNYIGIGRRRSVRENKDLELQNVLNWKWLNMRVIQGSALHAWVNGK